MKKWWILRGLKFLIFVALAVAFFSYAVMILWNWLIPEIFNGPVITFVQALGILVLTKILFGFGRGMGHRHFRKHAYWKKRFEERLSNMTPEERERFQERCGWNKHFAKDV